MSDSANNPSNQSFDLSRLSRTKLRAMMERAFDMSELNDLMFDLDVDEDAFPPGSKRDTARQLIEYMDRRGQLGLLVNKVRELRSNLDWSTAVAPAPAPPPTTTPPTTTSSTSSPTTKAESKGIESTQTITKAMVAFVRLLREPEMRSEVVSFQTDLEAMLMQIKLLSAYKDIHDMFQALESRFVLIHHDARRLPDDDTAWDSLMLNEPELQVKIDEMATIVQQIGLEARETRWVQQFVTIKENIRMAVEEFDHDTLQQANQRLSRILNRQPSRINAQLVTSAQALRLDSMAEAASNVHAKLLEKVATQESQVLMALSQRIQAGIVTLSPLDEQLSALGQEHSGWQELDDELRQVELSLEDGVDGLADAWFDIEMMLEDLTADETASWATALPKVLTRLQGAMDSGNLIATRRYFRRLRTQVGRRLRDVNEALWSCAQDAQNAGEMLGQSLKGYS